MTRVVALAALLVLVPESLAHAQSANEASLDPVQRSVLERARREPAAYARRITLLDQRIEELELERRQHSIGGGIALSVIGGVLTATGAGTVVIGALQEALCFDPFGCDEGLQSSMWMVGLVLGAVGTVVGLVLLFSGVGMASDARGRRRAVDERIRPLRRELEILESVGVFLDGDRAHVTLSARF
jgi:hypothetical protein